MSFGICTLRRRSEVQQRVGARGPTPFISSGSGNRPPGSGFSVKNKPCYQDISAGKDPRLPVSLGVWTFSKVSRLLRTEYFQIILNTCGQAGLAPPRPASRASPLPCQLSVGPRSPHPTWGSGHSGFHTLRSKTICICGGSPFIFQAWGLPIHPFVQTLGSPCSPSARCLLTLSVPP